MRAWETIVRKKGTAYVGYVTCCRGGMCHVMFFGPGDWSGWIDEDDLVQIGVMRS